MSNAAKKLHLEHPLYYGNLHCPKLGGFNFERGLHIDYGKLLSSWHLRCFPCLNHGTLMMKILADQSVVTGTNNELEDMGIDQIETSQQTNHFGIKYTSTEQFTETSLLKTQNVAATHSLYQDILAWASEAKCNKYPFSPQHLEQSSQVKHLENWLHSEPCHPETVELVLPEVLPGKQFR
jgi:hypothetical protein